MAEELLYICEDSMQIVSREWWWCGWGAGDKITGAIEEQPAGKRGE